LISQIEVIDGAIPLSKTEPEQLWTEEWSNQIFVKMQTSDGLVGWGEVLPAAGNLRDPYVSLINRLKEGLIGKDESDYKALWNFMRKVLFNGGYGVTTGAISGIDIAIWDIMGKRAGLPVSRLLGTTNSKVVRYASLSRYKRKEDLLPIIKNLLGSGYRAVKIHQPHTEQLESVRLIRSEFGFDFDLMVDLNCGFSYEEALDFVNRAQRFELKWMEEPVWPPDDFEALAKLNKVGPIAAGENCFSVFEFKRLLELDALSYYQPDIAKLGGITPMLEILKLLEEHSSKLAFHVRPDNGWVSLTASAHVGCAAKIDATIESPPSLVPAKYFEKYPELDSTTITVSGPGLGIIPKEPIPESGSSKLLQFHNS
jgi:L-alanine-DL-glutamate epimerase-like enolase superfamily enzyme